MNGGPPRARTKLCKFMLMPMLSPRFFALVPDERPFVTKDIALLVHRLAFLLAGGRAGEADAFIVSLPRRQGEKLATSCRKSKSIRLKHTLHTDEELCSRRGLYNSRRDLCSSRRGLHSSRREHNFIY